MSIISNTILAFSMSADAFAAAVSKGVVLREWNGQRYEVLSMADGTYEYDNKKYRSLSVIAKEIRLTGFPAHLVILLS